MEGGLQGVAASGVGWGGGWLRESRSWGEQVTSRVLAALRKNKCPAASAVS